jgi:heme-degrading monooxygenase HmoA
MSRMPIARLIYVSVAPEQMPEAERIWKQDCAPLMIQAPGCLSEELLKCLDAPGEYISYSEWQDQAAIDAYLNSQAHEEIRRHTRGLQSGERPVVKRYEVAG